MEFGKPGTSDQFTIKDHVGSLVIVAVNGFIPQYATSFGLRDTIRAEIVVIDGPGAGTRYPDGMIFSSKMVPQLKGQIGSVVLGRVNLGRAKPGQNAPYVLDEPTLGDVEIANKWVAENGDVVSVPVDTPPPAQQQPFAPPQQGYGVQEQWASQRAQHPAQQQQPYPQQYAPQGPPQQQYAGTFTSPPREEQPPF